MKLQRKLISCWFTIASFSVLLTSSLVQANNYAEPGFILTSVKPLQFIAADITQGVIESQYIVPAGASPHAYSLRPSEIKRINAAKSIYWVGPQLESFLRKPFAQHRDKSFALLAAFENKAAVTAKTPLLAELTVEQDNNHEDHDHDAQPHELSENLQHNGHQDEAISHEEDARDEHNHEHQLQLHIHEYQGRDPHIWLDPKLALSIANFIKQQTTILYPQHQALLEQNYQRFAQQINAADLQINAQLSNLRALGFVVFHDAYARFIEYYQLNQVAALTINPAKRPGAKHLATIRQLLDETKPVCIFSEPQFNTAAVTSVIRDFPIRVGQLDPLAIELEPQQDRYALFLKNFAGQFVKCLGNES
ncbi:zinc ABC transporter substrate-binding protein ZnuA [Gammaproteobacteria bacterium AS21]